MNTQATGAIRPKSARLSPAVPVKLADMRHELNAIREALPAGSLLWSLLDVAHQSVSLALQKIEADRLARETAGHSQTTEGRA